MIGDTIFAIASPPGPAERGIVRISGPDALEAANAVLETALIRERSALESAVNLLGHRVTCLVLVMPGPRSYTGEDVVELHLPGSPLLLEKVCSRLPDTTRQALPGEFTRRAFEQGRLDLAEAEAVLELIHAASEEDRRKALHMLDGGLGKSVDALRNLIQDALALLESGLDFTEGETGAVAPQSWLRLLRAAGETLKSIERSLPETHGAGEVLLLGAANAGKSSLCNALARRDAVLVSEQLATTRDVLRVEVEGDLVLLDAPGDLPAGSTAGLEHEALALRDRVAASCDAALLVVDLSRPVVPRTELRVLAVALTKVDLVPEIPQTLEAELPSIPHFPVSSVTGQGLDRLRGFLLQRAGSGPSGRGSRVRDLLGRAREALTEAVAGAGRREPEEVTAVGLGEVLSLLDEVHGRSSPEDLLDRIFSQFCLGK